MRPYVCYRCEDYADYANGGGYYVFDIVFFLIIFMLVLFACSVPFWEERCPQCACPRSRCRCGYYLVATA